jgi:thymidine phosphorylase
VSSIDAMGIARAAMSLGAGRDRVDATIDPAVGIVLAVERGDEVRPGQPLAELHHNDHRRLFEAIGGVSEAIVIGPEPPAPAPIVIDEVR